MSLLDHAVWWHVYPLGATGAPVHDGRGAERAAGTHEVVHRLPHLVPWLDHAVRLGCSGVLLGPVFTSTSHGYDTLDHLQVDPRLGDEADLLALVREARARGLHVLLDGVFNHVGRDHPLARRALATPADADPGPVRVRHGGGRAALVGWEGHDALAELDHARACTADLVVEVMLHWLRRGVAGWRLDVAYAVPSAFWREVLGRVRAEVPAAVFVGEVIHGDYAQVAADGTLDTVTQYELWKAAWSSVHDSNLWELAWALERHEEFSRRHLMHTFVGNHDVSRVASLAGGDDGAALAATVLLTVPGVPGVYHGDEFGWQGVRGEGLHADDPVRPALPAAPADAPGHDGALHRLHQQLVGLRRRHPWLVRARLQVTGHDDTWLVYRCTDGHGAHLQVRLDLAGRPRAEVTTHDGERVVWPG